MDKQNIAALSAMLIRAGFEEGIGYRLLQRICFNPAVFTMTERLQRNRDTLTCVLHFEKNGAAYTCGYYDVSLIKGIIMPERSIATISLQELDTGMGNIDWHFKPSDGAFLLNEEESWAREKNIAQLVTLLTRLSATEEGKYFADALKLKHWQDAGLEDLVGNLDAIRSRLEISQRVYFIDGEGISVDEAYRFLLNRWMEKKMQAKKREQGKAPANDNRASDGEGQGKRLLPKKRRTRIKRLKP